MASGLYFTFRSKLDGAPCVLIMTGKSGNRKTGDMLQTWILRSDISPLDALKARKDASICGDCPQRWNLGGGCYVVVGNAPRSVWAAWQRGAYQRWTAKRASKWAGRALRLGSYGDPAVVPAEVWREIFTVLQPPTWTGYTHQWANPTAQHLKQSACASVDTPGQYHAARSMGWRTFRTRKPGDPLLPNEFECPASEEEGFRLTCEECGACNGNPNNRPRAGNASIVVHGSLRKRAAKALVQLELTIPTR